MSALGLPLGARSHGGIVFIHTPVAFGLPSASLETPTATDFRALRRAIRADVYPGASVASGAVETNESASMATAAVPRGFNMVSVVWNAPHAAFHHPCQLWAPGDFVAHVTTTPRFPELYAQWTAPLQAQLSQMSPDSPPAELCGSVDGDACRDAAVPWDFEAQLPPLSPLRGGAPCPAQLWERDEHGRLTYVHPNRWDGYVSAGPITECVPLSAFSRSADTGNVVLSANAPIPGCVAALLHPCGSRDNVVLSRWCVVLRWCRPAECSNPAEQVEQGVDGEVAVAQGPFAAPGFQEVVIPFVASRHLQRLLPCAPYWRTHVHIRLLFNVSHGWSWMVPAEPQTVLPFAYLVADFHMDPWEDLPSRLTDFVLETVSDGHHASLLRGVWRARHTGAVVCRRGVATVPPAWRVYINETDHIEDVVVWEAGVGVPGTVILPIL